MLLSNPSGLGNNRRNSTSVGAAPPPDRDELPSSKHTCAPPATAAQGPQQAVSTTGQEPPDSPPLTTWPRLLLLPPSPAYHPPHTPMDQAPPPPTEQAHTIAALACTPLDATPCLTFKDFTIFWSMACIRCLDFPPLLLAVSSYVHGTSLILDPGRGLVQLLAKQMMASPLSSLAQTKTTVDPVT